MTENQRHAQKARSRRAITQAALRLVGDRPHLDFSMQEVADEAGVSLRTVYNHYASREELLEGVSSHIDELFRERSGVLIGDIARIDDLVDGVAANYRVFEQLGSVVGAADRLDRPADHPEAAGHDHRTTRIVELAREAFPELPDEVATRVGLVVRHLSSHRTWVALTADYGMTTPDAVDGVRWALRLLIDAARRGDIEGL